MPTRRKFLQSSAVVAAALSGAGSGVAVDAAPSVSAPSLLVATLPRPASEIQVPKMKFFHAEISRLVLGVNPFCGYSHYNNNYSGVMKDWYTEDRVCASGGVVRRAALGLHKPKTHRRWAGGGLAGCGGFA